MIGLISLILPIFLLIALGFGAVRGRIIADGMAQAIAAFVMNFALPALILHALLRQDFRETFNWAYVVAYGGGSVAAAFAVLLAGLLLVLRRPMPRAAMAAMGGCASNTGFVGFPVASLAVGAAALPALPLTILIENILVMPLAIVLAEASTQEGRGALATLRHTFARLVRTPMMMAIIVGVVLAAAGFRPPVAIARTMEMLSNAAVPCALFVVGATLAGLKPGAAFQDVWLIALGKLVLHPLLVLGAFMLVGGVPAELMTVGIILASAPMLTIYPIVAGRFGQAQMGAAALLATTAISFFTLLAVLAMLGLAGP